jgi:predicted nucleic acid-binding Zn ribbon protein
MSRRRAPRPAAAAVREVVAAVAPRTLLAEVQRVWADACGEAVAAEASPVSERDGVVTVACRSATWASELDLMQSELVERMNGLLRDHTLEGLRFTADAARHEGG